LFSLGKRRLRADLSCGLLRNMGTNILAGPVAIGQGNGLRLKQRRFRLRIRKKFFIMRVAKALAQVVQRGGRCSIPRNVKGHVERGL